MNIIKDKKGFFPAIGITLTVGTLIVIGVIIVALMIGFGVLLNFITTNIFALAGVALLIFSLILLSKKSISQKIGLFLIILSIILILVQFSGVTQTFATTFTPVYCNDYEFTCCNYITGNIDNVQLSSINAYKCPYEKCFITLSGVTAARIGSKNCRIESNWLGAKYYVCDDSYSFSGTSTTITKGYQIWIDYGGTQRSLSGNYEYYVLGFCGTSACGQGTKGVPVPGADRCAFTVQSGTIYSNTGTKIGNSYVVPERTCVLSWQSGNRHICGNLEEKCSSDSDCGGHTYGNKECYARTLQTYGCKQLSLPTGVKLINSELIGADTLPGITNPSYSGVISRCEIVKAESVQCCGDTDCGSSYVCDKTTFTCKPAEQVQCNSDSDCGVSSQCDFTTKQMKYPACISNNCGYKTKIVECCYDINCATGYYCSADKKCIKSTITKKECPFDCCIYEQEYIDKPCANNLYCNNHICTTTPPIGGGIGEVCEDKLFGLIPGSISTTSKCEWYDLLCNTGITKPTTVSECKYDYTFIILIIGGVLIAVAMIILIKPNNTSSKIKYVYRRRK